MFNCNEILFSENPIKTSNFQAIASVDILTCILYDDGLSDLLGIMYVNVLMLLTRPLYGAHILLCISNVTRVLLTMPTCT